MPLTTYIAGEILTASSLNANLSFAATNPPAAASGLELITSQTVSAVVDFSLPADTFSATYRNYKVIVDGLNSASGSAVTLRMRAGGVDDTASNYFGSVTGTDVGGGANLQGSNSVSAFVLQQTSTNATHYTFDVIAPQLATNSQWSGTFLARSSVSITAGSFSGMFLGATVFDSLTIIAAGGTTFTGVFRVYGYANN